MSSNFYLKGLDGLRAVAALSVVIGHIELTKMNRGIDNKFHWVENWGHLGVILFFVLSGFLITTLLLKEKKERNSISIKQFYVRRILRVWPLYFIILILSAILFSYQPKALTLVLCGTIFPNIAHAFQLGWAVSPQIWSIGVEEQFYLFWPSLLRTKPVIFITICILLVVGLPIAPHILQFILNKLSYSSDSLRIVEKIFEVLTFDAMAIGALLSILYFSPKKKIQNLISRYSFSSILFVPLPFILWFSGFSFGFINTTIYSMLFGIMILYLISGFGASFFEWKPIKYLGKISYGIYMYHWIIMLLAFNLFSDTKLITTPIIHIIILVTTIVIASFSFYYVEGYFLKLKRKFERI